MEAADDAIHTRSTAAPQHHLSAGLSLAVFLSSLALTACVASESTEKASERVAETHQEFSSFGIERVIPLRIVEVTNDCHAQPVIDDLYKDVPAAQPPADWNTCTPCTDDPDPVGHPNCGPDTVGFDAIKRAVERANFALRAVHVQVYVSMIEKYAMPTFYTTCNPSDLCPERPWGQVSAELQKVFPNACDNSGQKFAEIDWITRAKQSSGDPSRIDVLVAHYSNGGEGRRAWEGPATLTCDSWLFDRPQALAHEVGHIIGLEHPMQPEQAAVRDPELQADNGTAEPWKYWDLFYSLGPAPNYTPKVYFSSRESARSFAADGGALYTKATWNDGHNCTVDNHCTLTCNIGQFNGKGAAEQVTLGDEGAKGLAFTFVGDNPPSSYQRGVNTMLYVDDPLNSCQRTSFSDSQAEQVKKILRSDILAQAGWLGYDLSMKIPTRRYALGNIRSVSGFEQVDFDKDGKRDIAVWEPPETAGGTGTFRVLTSSSAYTTELTRQFGLSGDVPVPADYDGGGFTDFAVIRRGLMNASDPYDSGIYWVWCSSQHNQDCGTDNWGYGYDQWGYQQDVPLPGLEFDGNPNTKEVAVYRPSNGRIYWKVVGSATWWTIYTRFQFNPNFTHLNGLYDSDNKTDLVSYDEQNGRFYILLSTRNWDINQVIVRDVNSALAPNAVLAYDAGASAPAIRFGGVPVVAEKSGRRVLRATLSR